MAFFCIFRKWIFSYLGENWRSASGPLSKQEVELEMWSVVRTGTSFSSQQAAKAPTEAHSEKKKTKEAIRKCRLNTSKKLPVALRYVKRGTEGRDLINCHNPITARPALIQWASVRPAATTGFTRQNSTVKRAKLLRMR